MKYTTGMGVALLFATAPAFAAPDSCERVKSDIQQRIINNGVPEQSFTLTLEPNDQTPPQGAQVVGHCANDNWKILYTRTDGYTSPTGDAPSP